MFTDEDIVTGSTQGVLIGVADDGVRAREYATTVDFGIVLSTLQKEGSPLMSVGLTRKLLHSSKSRKDTTKNVGGGSAGRIGCLSLLGEVLGEAKGSGFGGVRA